MREFLIFFIPEEIIMSYKKFDNSDLVDKALQEENLRSARCVISNICPFDRTFTTGEFEDALEYVIKVKGVDIFEPFDASLNPLYGERVDRKDPTLEEDDFAVSVAYLKENFCPERIEDTKKLGRYLFPNEMHNKNNKSSSNNSGLKSDDVKRYLANITKLLDVGYAKIKEIDKEMIDSIKNEDNNLTTQMKDKRVTVERIVRTATKYISIISKENKEAIKASKKAMDSYLFASEYSDFDYSYAALECTLNPDDIALEDTKRSIIQKIQTTWKTFITKVFNFFKRMIQLLKNKVQKFRANSLSKKVVDGINLSMEDIKYLENLDKEIEKIKEM